MSTTISISELHQFELSTGCFGGDIVSFDAWSAQAADEDTIGSGFRYSSVLRLISDVGECGIETRGGLLGLLSIFNQINTPP